MLNVKELRKKFNAKLVSLTKQDLQNWLDFDKERENLELLKKEETINLKSDE